MCATYYNNPTTKDIKSVSKQMKYSWLPTHAHLIFQTSCFNSLAHWRCGRNFTNAFFKVILQIDISNTSRKSGLEWVPRKPNNRSTLVQVMVWFRQAPSHYLSLQWCKNLSPYGVTRPQWVKNIAIELHLDHDCCNKGSKRPIGWLL